jgi:hypothetical protein
VEAETVMQDSAELHEKTIRWFMRRLLGSPEEREGSQQSDREMDQAVEHAIACQQCLGEMDATVRVLSQGTDSLTPSCQDCAPILGEVASIDETQARNRFPRVWLHLQVCGDCRAAVVRLRNMMTRERAGVYGRVPGAPVFGATTMTMPSDMWQHVRKGVHRLALHLAVFSQADEVTLRPVQDGRALPAGQLPPGWRLQPVTVPIRRARGARKPGAVWSTTLPVDGGLEIRLTACRADREHLELEVTVGSDQPVAGARVTLTDEHGFSPWVEETDELGTAFLADVSQKRYTLEVVHAGSTWLIPLELSPA